MNKILGILLIAMVSTLSLAAQEEMSKKEKRKQKKVEQFKEIQALVADKDFEFVADRAHPAGYRDVDLTTNTNFLRIQSDSAHSHMPFFGRAFASTPGEQGGIHFETAMLDKEIEVDEKKMNVAITFEAKEDGKHYNCRLEIYGGGSASLSITSNHLQQISYNGKVKEYIIEE